MKTVAVIPAYNEAGHVGGVVRETLKYADMVIVVDDGSMDETSGKAESAGALVLRHMVNMGKGFALKTGCDKAVGEGDLMVVIDADGQHDPRDIPKMVDVLEQEGLDLVVGSRPLDENMPLIQRVGNFWINFLSNALFGIRVTDTQSGFRVFTRDAYQKMRWLSRGYFVETEMLINAGKHKLRYREMPIKTVYHNAHKGTTLIDGVRISLNMLAWKIRK